MSRKIPMGPSTPQPAITVNVDEWLQERQAGLGGLKYPGQQPIQIPANASPEAVQKIRQQQEELRDAWAEKQALIARHAHLAKGEDAMPLEKECAECGQVRAYYANDFLCWQCRDAQED